MPASARRCGEPALVGAAVEEILRLPSPVQTPEEGKAAGLPRWAKTDIEINGTTIRTGELVLLDLQGANLDKRSSPRLRPPTLGASPTRT